MVASATLINLTSLAEIINFRKLYFAEGATKVNESCFGFIEINCEPFNCTSSNSVGLKFSLLLGTFAKAFLLALNSNSSLSMYHVNWSI